MMIQDCTIPSIGDCMADAESDAQIGFSEVVTNGIEQASRRARHSQHAEARVKNKLDYCDVGRHGEN